jgi:hypothetical protein
MILALVEIVKMGFVADPGVAVLSSSRQAVLL